ncbi:MAG: restriction endonuclease subunit S [Shewanella xiamenensis]|nr:restriction endonuclease subunit S [Shewanella xiamenensis]
MSQLNYLEKLLDGVEVEWTTLGNEHAVEIANSGRKPVKAALRLAGETPYYGANNIQDYVDGYTHDGEFVLIAEDGSASLENYSIQYATGRFWANNHVHVVRGKEVINTRYLYHYLCIVNFVPFLSGGGRAKLTKGKLVDIPLPIPCPDSPEKSLAIQAEIVRILDAFTAMTAELTAELNMRKKQYNYYRDKLLSFEEGEVEWKTLGDVTQLITKGTTPKEFVSDGVNFIKLESFDDNQIKPDKFMFITPEVHNKELKRSILEEGDILFAIAGATIGKCAIVDKSVLPANTNQALAIVRLTQQVNVKFAFYYMQTTAMTDYIAKFNKTSAQPNINLKQMSEFKIPVPTINEQIRIVKILDNFNTLTSSIKEGLPREIELRQKQYEYYRDLLLSFPKSHSDEAA